MDKVLDLEAARQKRKEEQEKNRDLPPFIRLRGKDGKIAVYPKWEKGPDGEWRIMHLDAVRAMLGYGKEETDKRDEPKED